MSNPQKQETVFTRDAANYITAAAHGFEIRPDENGPMHRASGFLRRRDNCHVWQTVDGWRLAYLKDGFFQFHRSLGHDLAAALAELDRPPTKAELEGMSL